MAACLCGTCCCCIDLKKGCFVLGYMELVAGFSASIFVLVELVKLSFKMVPGIILMLILALLLAFNITLLVGLHKEKRGHVLAYFIFKTIFLVLFGCFQLVMIFYYGVPPIGIIFQIIIFAILLYFLLVINSYYHKMGDSNNGAIYNTA